MTAATNRILLGTARSPGTHQPVESIGIDCGTYHVRTPIRLMMLNGNDAVGEVPIPQKHVAHVYAAGAHLSEPLVICVADGLQSLRPGRGRSLRQRSH